MINKVFYLALFGVFLLACIAPAHAQSNYSSLESHGLYGSSYEGGLGSDTWRNTDRKSLSSLLKKSPNEPKNKNLFLLQKRLLLTEARASLDGEAPEPGHDMLTKRMEKLLDMGLYKEAAEMYRTLNKEPYHANLARTAILALLYTGEKAFACIEGKTLKEAIEPNAFLDDFNAYCDISLSDDPPADAKKKIQNSDRKILAAIAGKKSYQFEYSPKAFEKLSYLEQAALIADQKIDPSTIKDAQNIPARHLSLFATYEDLSPRVRLNLISEGLSKGVLTQDVLEEFYNDINKKNKSDDLPASKRDQLAYYYDLLPKTASSEKWAVAQRVFALQNAYGLEALLPFTTQILNMRPTDPDLGDVKKVVLLTSASAQTLPVFWYEQLAESLSKNEKSRENTIFMIAAYLLLPTHAQSDEKRNQLEGFMSNGLSDNVDIVKIIIENIDKKNKIVHNAHEIYEKDFDIASTVVYKMPQVDVWDRLKTATQDNIKSEAILLSATLLDATDLVDMYPGLLQDVLDSFEAVGLTSISKNWAVEALLETIQ